MMNKGVDDVLYCNKKYIAESIQDIVTKFNKSRKPNLKEMQLFQSKFEAL